MPRVLLALRATPKSDHDVNSAQLTLGTTLRLPGQFFSPPDSEAPQNHTEYARNLESALSSVRAPPPVWHRNQRFYVDPCLYSAKYCFIRNDGKKSLFELPYKGPYKIISRNDNFFTHDLRDRDDNVSIDRLKSAHILPSYETDTAMQNDTFDSQYCAVAESNSFSRINTQNGFNVNFDEAERPIFRNRYGRQTRHPSRFDDFESD